jgi:hypothetical protein
MYIGLIGGIEPAATEFYYRNLVRAHAAANCAVELTIAHAGIRDLVQNLSDNAPDKQCESFSSSNTKSRGRHRHRKTKAVFGRLCERLSQPPNALSNLTFAQGCIPENNARAPWRFYIEWIYGVQSHTGLFGFADHILDHSATPPFQPDKKMEPGIRTANLCTFGELLVYGGH